ncbi:MAG TPA: hypothetical protein VM925_15085 [Labilithrix sp.]|nr:hypothetical protein [Labilithrix sp.]
MAKRKCILPAIVALSFAAFAATSCSSSKKATQDDLTFASKIQPLVQEKCQTCHQSGGIAPFPLVTYEDVKSVGAIARDKVARREMPPWGPFADPDCVVSHGFEGDLSLTDEQIEMFGRWVDRGMSRGDVSRPAPPPSTAASPVVGLVDKTDTLETATQFVVEAGGPDELRCFPIDPGFTEDTWVGESIVVPGDPKVVHHALVYLDPRKEGITMAGADGSYPCFGGPELSGSSLLLAWSPGGTSTTYGEGAGLLVPKDAHLVLQVHYHPLATASSGRMSVELKKLPEKPPHVATFVLVGNAESADDRRARLLPGPNDPPDGPTFLIPSNAKDHTETMEFVMPFRQTRLSAVGAHMHWAGSAMKVEVLRKRPEPARECVLSTRYDFNWQRTYTYDAPLDQLPVLRSGDTLRITCTYDNTTDNRLIVRAMNEARRKSPAPIRLGGTSADEMCQAILVFVE